MLLVPYYHDKPTETAVEQLVATGHSPMDEHVTLVTCRDNCVLFRHY